MMKMNFRIFIYAAWLVITMPDVCKADMGLPMIFLTMPTMLIALVPIILLEAFVARPYLKLPIGRILKGSGLANLFSTLIGIPVTWSLLVVLQIVTGGTKAYGLATPLARVLAVTWQAPWLIPYEGDLRWMLPAATLFLLIPFFFVSWWVEFLVMKHILKEVEIKLLKRTVGWMNFISYCGLALYVALRMHV